MAPRSATQIGIGPQRDIFDSHIRPSYEFQLDNRGLILLNRQQHIYQIPTFAKEEALLIQCVQCMKTAWVELDRWRDFAVLCDQWDDVDWDRIVRLCREHRYLRSLALTLHLVAGDR
ncbi:nucleotidyltransferase family protein [Gammaproteobacteria bacterium]|nr:nucleotidyltransferase family protein [Gammaproteobacteria bacterium]